MSTVSLYSALNKALFDEMANNEKVICIGEDIGKAGGCWGYFTGLEKKYGTNRILEMPLAEAGYSLFGVGTTLGGYRPVVEYMMADFGTLGAETMINVAPKFRYMSGGKDSCPITFILPQGIGGRSGCQHSQFVESWFTNVPGLKIVAPTFPEDIYLFLRASIEDDDPVAFIFERSLLSLQGEFSEGKEIPSLAHAANIVKEGDDLTLVAYQRALVNSLEAVKQVEAETGKTIEIIDPRVLIPFDKEKVFNSVRKTGRLVVAHNAPERGGFGSLVSSWVSENCFDALKAPVVRVGGKNTIIPFGKAEDLVIPSMEDIKEGILKALK